MNRSSRIFFTLFFLIIGASILYTYYYIVLHKHYVVFTDPETIPEPTDVIANFFGVERSFEQE